MTNWQELYAKQLEGAVIYYTSGDNMKLDLTLKMMAAQIYNGEMAQKLADFTAKLDKDTRRQLKAIDDKAYAATTYAEQRRIYNKMDEVMMWYFTELIKKHQGLAAEYKVIKGD